MLEQLFGSHTRMKLLQLFLSNPEEKYFVRELTRILDSQINAVRRELENLSEFGIIVLVEEEGVAENRKFYQINSKFVLFPELKSIFQKSQFLLEKKFANALKKTGKIYYLALTGSFVGDKDIPTDLLIVGNLSKNKFQKVLKSFERDLHREINYTFLEKDEFNYRRSVADRFIYSLLDADKIVMIDEIFNNYEPENEAK
jgi:predicted transcriptional regulator